LIVLEVVDLHADYALAQVLRGVSLQAPAGRVVALLGRNGAGKTTLVRTIMDMVPPQVGAGSIRYQGQELLGRTPHEVARLGIGLVPQGRRVFRSLTVLEHLQIAARPPRNGSGGYWDLERVFALFPRLAERKLNRGGALSGGEQQMLAIGRALMGNPSLLLMDEPSEGLAPLLLQQLGEQLLQLKAAGMAIFLVEQNLGLALKLADELYILDRGQVVYEGTPAALEASADVKQRHLGVG
jgi:branched-chain amino acid transport system ATP-binding protein